MLRNILHHVGKPGRYLGCEVGSVSKELDSVKVRFCLAFPDVYEVGFSHIGLKILYQILNDMSEVWAERVYCPWNDMEQALRDENLPLTALESKDPLSSFDIVGFSLQHELCTSNVLVMLDLGGIPLRASERKQGDPIIIGGGPGAANPEPMSAFFDAFLFGEGEEATVEIAKCIEKAKNLELSREETLSQLSEIEGIFIPSIDKGRIRRRLVKNLDQSKYFDRPLIPTVEPVHDRYAVEIQRGCSRGCRFCQAGFIYRPTRQRSPKTIIDLAHKGLAGSGQQTLGMLSLSASDYGCLIPVVERLFDEHAGEHVSIQLPSLRAETLTDKLAEALNKERKTAFTLAPETATDRMRKVINKGNTEEDLLQAVQSAFSGGWKHLKLYFMIGLPTETDEDVRAIIDLAAKAKKLGRQINKAIRLTVSVSTFVPKPHTPFQWHTMISEEDIIRKQELLREGLRRIKASFKWHDARASLLEAALARGDARLSDVIESAYKSGTRFDAWTDQLDLESWKAAFAEAGIDFHQYVSRPFSTSDELPWRRMDSGVDASYLLEEYEKALSGDVRPDCAYDICHDCGVCDHKNIGRDVYDDEKTTEKHRSHVKYVDVPNAERPHISTSPIVRKIRFKYEKTDWAVYLGHLDMINQISRAFKRSGIRLKHSEGFHPKPRISFSQALPLGVSSLCEFFDAEVQDPSPVVSLVSRLNANLPRGVRVCEAMQTANNTPSLSESIIANQFSFDLTAMLNEDELSLALKSFEESEDPAVTRVTKKGMKEIYLKDYIDSLKLASDGKVEATIAVHSQRSLKPSELLSCVFSIGDQDRGKVFIEKLAVRFAPPSDIKDTKKKPISYRKAGKESRNGAEAHNQRSSRGDPRGAHGERSDR